MQTILESRSWFVFSTGSSVFPIAHLVSEDLVAHLIVYNLKTQGGLPPFHNTSQAFKLSSCEGPLKRKIDLRCLVRKIVYYMLLNQDPSFFCGTFLQLIPLQKPVKRWICVGATPSFEYHHHMSMPNEARQALLQYPLSKAYPLSKKIIRHHFVQKQNVDPWETDFLAE